MSANCVEVGDANPDVAGIGIILSFSIQAGIAIIISFYSFYLEFKIAHHSAVEIYQKKREIANKILIQGGDVQTITGISLLLTAIMQIGSLPFYHLHIIYDTVSFVGYVLAPDPDPLEIRNSEGQDSDFVSISLCASAVCTFNSDMDGKYIRYILIALFAVLYLAYASLFGTHLQSWNYNNPGHCYNTSKIALRNASHPYVDTIYLAMTCFYFFAVLSWALGLVRPYIDVISRGISKLYSIKWLEQRLPPLNPQITLIEQIGVLNAAALQFPLHVYSIFALRSSNEPLLNSGSSEQQWGFGQIVAMVLLANNLIVLLSGIQDYRKKSEQGKSTQTNPLVANHNTGGILEVDQISHRSLGDLPPTGNINSA